MEHINGFKAAVAAVLGGLTALWGWFGWLVLASLLCMALDYGTGTAAALRAGEWSSKVARDGLWHKLGAVVAVLVAAILDGVIGLILANIPALELPFQYEVFVSVLVLVWYTMTELGSIVENIGALGAPVPAWLRKAIAALESTVDGAGDKLGLGNSIDALQDARRAVQLDPNNTEYQMHLRRMQNPGQTYRTQTTYAQPGGLMRWCWSMILLNLLCNCCCGSGWGWRFRM